MEDAKIRVIRLRDVEPSLLRGVDSKDAGWVRRLVHPLNHVNTKSIAMGIIEAGPGYSPHRWHNHVRDKGVDYELVYPEGFEEVYYVLSGSGVVQWKRKDGKIEEESVGAGDTIFFPQGVAEHQLLNNSSDKLMAIYFSTPIPIHK